MWVMYDSIEPGQIPAHASAVAGYVGGKWPDYAQEVKRWPHAQHLSIAVNASEDADCLDVETGDAKPGEAPAWFFRQRKREVHRPCFYANLSTMGSVIVALNKAGIHRDDYRLWTAHYTYHPHICGPSEGLTTHADATQWDDKALGRNLDESLCSDTFFLPVSPYVPYVPHDEANWIREWDRIKGRKTMAAHFRRLFLRDQMFKRRALISRRASNEAHGWEKLNRIARWHALRERTS
jgi:hypothetical protein